MAKKRSARKQGLSPDHSTPLKPDKSKFKFILISALMGLGVALGLQFLTGYFSLAQHLAKFLPALIPQSVWFIPLTLCVVSGLSFLAINHGKDHMLNSVYQLSLKWKDFWKKDTPSATQQTLLTRPSTQSSAKALTVVQQKLVYRTKVDIGVSKPEGFFGHLSYYSKVFVACALSPMGIMRVARIFPPAARLFEYTTAVYNGDIDDLHMFIRTKQYDKAIELIKLVPPDVLDRMLMRRDEEGRTPFYNVGARYYCHDVFQAMIDKLTPEDRIKHLTLGNQFEMFPISVMTKLISNLGDVKLEKSWRIVMDSFTKQQQFALLMAVDEKGDSLFHDTRNIFNLLSNNEILNILDKQTILASMGRECSHGTTPLTNIISLLRFESVKRAMEMLDKTDWQEIFSHKPKGWAVTLGEKALIAAYISCDGRFKSPAKSGALFPYEATRYEEEAVRLNVKKADYLKNEYGLQLPKELRDLPAQEFKTALLEIRENQVHNYCRVKESFKQKHGFLPEKILNMENLLPQKHYTKAYREMQREQHPDRNLGQNTVKSAELNEARDFILNRKTRKSYAKQSKI